MPDNQDDDKHHLNTPLMKSHEKFLDVPNLDPEVYS